MSDGLLLSMVVRNETGRFLERMLQRALPFADKTVIIDDASTDATPDICEELLKRHEKKGEVIRLKTSLWSQEHELRRMQWNVALEHAPKYILILDADEVIEPKATKSIPLVLGLDTTDVMSFRFFDMWDEEHYRDDDLWNIHRRNVPRLARVEDLPPSEKWFEKNQHCGCWPPNFLGSQKRWVHSNLGVQHLGWSREEDRRTKYERYMKHDPEGRWGSLAQYRSILDLHPNLVKF